MPTPFTLQQVFDRALNGIRAQQYRRAVSQLEGCAYLSHNGDKCAIGHCIDDPELARRIDSNPDADTSIEVVLPLHSELQDLFNGIDAQVLSDLQEIHDKRAVCPGGFYTGSPEEFEQGMQSFAKVYGLTYAPPSNSTHQEPA